MSDVDLVFKKVNILKNLYWFVLFLGISFGMFFTLITPSIKDFRVKNLDLKDSLTNALNYQKEYDMYHKEMVKLRDENKNTLIALDNKYVEEKIVAFISSYFPNFKIVDQKVDESHEEFIKYEFSISTTITNPAKFYELVDGLNRFSNIVEVDFPIEFNKDDKKIEHNFVLRVFELKRKNRKF